MQGRDGCSTVLDTEHIERPSGSAVHGAEPPSLWGVSGHFLWGNSAQNDGGSGEVAIFLAAAAAITAARAAIRVGQLSQGPRAMGTMAFLGLAIPSCVPGRCLGHDIKGRKTIS